MSVGSWILSIVLFIVSLGILIVIHELGHFSMAKLFNVYCQEFSIGFGPALLHHRKKGKETYFSIRAIPLGGYVSMYGEGIELEDGVVVPPERGIEGIKRWKKAIVVSAGVILNALLAFVIFSVSNLCFPVTKISTSIRVDGTSTLYAQGLRTDDKLYIIGPSDPLVKIDDTIKSTEEPNGITYKGYFYILNDDVDFNGGKYVLCWYPTTNNSEPVFIDSFKLYPADLEGKISKTKIFSSWANWSQTHQGEDDVVLKYYPDITKAYIKPYEGVKIKTTLSFNQYLGTVEETKIYSEQRDFNVEIYSMITAEGKYKWSDIGLKNQIVKEWLPFSQRLSNTCADFGNASVAIFKGLGVLLTGGINQMSGIVGIFSQSASILNNYTFNTYLYFWGLISVNLAVVNLLPFPGLDGWTLLVTAIEGSVNLCKRGAHKRLGKQEEYVEWKIPTKVKNIVSFVGLILLFILMAVIIGFDIARLMGAM